MNRFAILAWILAIISLPNCGEKEEKPIQPAEKQTTIVQSNELKIRISPNTQSAEIGKLTRGTEIKILQKSAEPIKIGNLEAHWYQIVSPEGLKGWVYGAYLNVDGKEDNSAVEEEKTEKKMKEMLTGQWYAAGATGTLTNYFVTIFPSGEIEFGTGKKGSQSGKYTTTYSMSKLSILTNEMKKPLMTNLTAELRGETLLFSGKIGEQEYKLHLSEKHPESMKEAAKKKAEPEKP